jgi:hypothetical protein
MLALLPLLVAASSWVPPAQASWRTSNPPAVTVKLTVGAEPISMAGEATFKVKLGTVGGSLSVSPFLQFTRGITLEVRDRSGRIVTPAEPPPFSPPAPPLSDDSLIPLSGQEYIQIDVKEPAKWFFPRPGRYRVRASVVVMNCRSETACLEGAMASSTDSAGLVPAQSAPIEVLVTR